MRQRGVAFPLYFRSIAFVTDLAIRAADETDLGNKALALWAALKLRSRRCRPGIAYRTRA